MPSRRRTWHVVGSFSRRTVQPKAPELVAPIQPYAASGTGERLTGNELAGAMVVVAVGAADDAVEDAGLRLDAGVATQATRIRPTSARS